MKLYIKHMVSVRCIMMVKEELNKLKIPYLSVELGEAETKGTVSDMQQRQIKIALLKSGLELMENKKLIIIEKIKTLVIEMIHYTDEIPKINFSNYLSNKLDYDYTYLANIFSETEGTTIEQYILLHKIERIKELIIDDELNLTEIADKLHYSSIGALSNQFKKITGQTPSCYKSLRKNRRNTLENV